MEQNFSYSTSTALMLHCDHLPKVIAKLHNLCEILRSFSQSSKAPCYKIEQVLTLTIFRTQDNNVTKLGKPTQMDDSKHTDLHD